MSVAKIPSWRDMDPGIFLQHWDKRHHYAGVFDRSSAKFPDDDAPLWWSIKRFHDKVHAGEWTVSATDGQVFGVPTDHVHLPSVSKLLEELL